MANLSSFEMLLGQALQAAKVDMLHKRANSQASMTLAKRLLEDEMKALLNRRFACAGMRPLQ